MQSDNTEQTNVEPEVTRWLGWIVKATVICSILAVVASIVFFAWWGLKDYFVFGGEKFNRDNWLSAVRSADNPCYRGDMAYELQQKLLIKGVGRNNVISLLGKPSWEDDTSIEYDLGQCLYVEHGIRIFFDAAGGLVYSKIAQH